MMRSQSASALKSSVGFSSAFAVRLLAGDLHRLDILQRRFEAAELAPILLEESVERLRTALAEPVLPLTAPGQRTDVADFLGVGDRVRDQLALDQPVDEAAVEAFLGADGVARSTHF